MIEITVIELMKQRKPEQQGGVTELVGMVGREINGHCSTGDLLAGSSGKRQV